MPQFHWMPHHPPLDYAQLYRVLAETASDAIVAIDETGVVLAVNPAGEALFGYHADELIGQPLTRVMPERFHERHAHGLGRYVRTGERHIPWRTVFLPILTKDGREIPAEISFGELSANGHRIFSGIIRDVSARVAAEQAAAEGTAQLQEQAAELEHQVDEAQRLGEELEESNRELSRLNAELAAVVEAITDGFVALDAAVRFTYVNARAASMWGMPASALLGRTPAEVWPALDMDRSAVLMLLRRVLASRQTESIETLSPTLGTWIEIRAYPAARGGIVAFFQDVSERRRARELDALLAEASQLLASSTDYDETLANVARAMVPRLGDWSAVDLLDDPAATSWPPVMRRVAIVHDDPAGLALATELTTKYPQRWDDASGQAGVIRHGRPLFIPDLTDEMLVAGASDAEHLRLLRAIDFHSVIIVPIVARGEVLGALTLCMTTSRRRYTEADLALAEDLGRRAAVALDTVRLLRDARDARAAAEEAVERTTRLQHVTARLAGALTEREVADVVMAEGLPALDATDGVVYLLSEDGRNLEHAASAGAPAATTAEFRVFPLDAPLPLSDAVRTGESIVLETRDDVVSRYPALREANAQAHTDSWIALPLRAGDTTLGGMALGFETERRFTDADRAFAETLARLCGQALLRARLYDDADRARAQAEEANAAKLSFLATMSHELRTPLNAIAGHVQLMEMGLHGPVTDAQRDALERVNRAQAHLLGIINDILTYAKVESGRIEYALKPVDPATLIRDVCALVEPQFIAKQIRLGMELPRDTQESLRAMVDPEKLTQVLLNLLSNALKFTPSPGSVTVSSSSSSASEHTSAVNIAVRDSGVGIPADKLESIFEPFVQLGRGLTTTHEGTGLGLAVSRDLARGMGGELTVSSEVGKGSEFTLRLPRAKNGVK
jgi:PAS domain S-box-containing protein